MEITIKGEAKEIAALVLAVRGRQKQHSSAKEVKAVIRKSLESTAPSRRAF